MQDENLTLDQSDAGAVDVTATEGGQRDESVVPFFEAVNAQLKTSYKSDDAAVKGLKELQSYVGKKVEATQVAEPVQEGPKTSEELAEIKERLFFSEHPEYREYAGLIKEFGGDPEKVVSSDAFKTVFSKVKAYDEQEASKSVLSSSNRLGEVTDKFQEAREAAQSGKHTAAADMATEAVLDSLGMK